MEKKKKVVKPPRLNEVKKAEAKEAEKKAMIMLLKQDGCDMSC